MQRYIAFEKTVRTAYISASSPRTAEDKFRKENGIGINTDVVVIPATFARVNGIEIKSEIKNFKRIE